MNAAIAQHLNIPESMIASIEEWAHVLFVRFISGRTRFVFKKVKPVMKNRDFSANLFSDMPDFDESAADSVDAMVSQINNRLPIGHCASYSKIHSAACEVLRGETSIDEAVVRLTSKKPIKRSR